MDERGGSFVAVRRLSHGIERGNGCHSNPVAMAEKQITIE
ncbi:unnamed protein product [Victoria cruziana]